MRNDMQTTEKRQKARYRNNKTLVNVLDWEGAFGADAPVGERSVIIVLPRAEKNYEIEKTYETARVTVFANYRGEAPMHKLVPQMAGLMWTFWNTSKAKTPEEHSDDIANQGAYNQWFGADMEVKEEGDDAVVECVFEVLSGACTKSSNPDPNPNPQLVITRLTLEGKGANGTTIKGYPRPGSKGVSKNAVAFRWRQWGQSTRSRCTAH